MAKRMRMTVGRLSEKLENEIPEVICTPKDDEFQITVTLLKKNGFTFDLLSPRQQQQMAGGYLDVREYAEITAGIRDLL